MTHVVLLCLLHMQPENSDMMTTPRGTTNIPQSSPRTAVRRNLLTEFNEADSPVCPMYREDLNTPCVETELATTEGTAYVSNSTGWGQLIGFWFGVIPIFTTLLYVAYQFFPGGIVMWATRELIIVLMFAITFVILISVVYKCWKSTGRSGGGYRQRSVRGATPRGRSDFLATPEVTDQTESSVNIPVKRTFSGDGSTTWTEFFRYFENVANLNQWTVQRKRGVLLTTLRGQAETYAYGLPDNTMGNYQHLTEALNQRFGYTALKDSYIAEAKLRRKHVNETFRDYGQAIEDLFRRAYPGNRACVDENSLKTFLDNCSENEEFRMSVKRTRPKTIQEAVTSAMQEECIRLGEERSLKNSKTVRRDIYTVNPKQLSRGIDKSYQNGKNYNTRKRCYTCGSLSHLRNQCPSTNSFARRENGGAVPQGKDAPPRQ